MAGDSGLKHMVKRRVHLERFQPKTRRQFGLLEKKKDYKLRALDYQRKRRVLAALSEKGRARNPDEFSFRMLSSSKGRNDEVVVNLDPTAAPDRNLLPALSQRRAEKLLGRRRAAARKELQELEKDANVVHYKHAVVQKKIKTSLQEAHAVSNRRPKRENLAGEASPHGGGPPVPRGRAGGRGAAAGDEPADVHAAQPAPQGSLLGKSDEVWWKRRRVQCADRDNAQVLAAESLIQEWKGRALPSPRTARETAGGSGKEAQAAGQPIDDASDQDADGEEGARPSAQKAKAYDPRIFRDKKGAASAQAAASPATSISDDLRKLQTLRVVIRKLETRRAFKEKGRSVRREKAEDGPEDQQMLKETIPANCSCSWGLKNSRKIVPKVDCHRWLPKRKR
eukprot:GHVT01018037.1.p1 GENE.GHVT01018037.1~~GHVT01018037.1.p1  ORF type:complete len:395 (-),score=107.04 GHVT01018037.1:229-1413(-)